MIKAILVMDEPKICICCDLAEVCLGYDTSGGKSDNCPLIKASGYRDEHGNLVTWIVKCADCKYWCPLIKENEMRCVCEQSTHFGHVTDQNHSCEMGEKENE